MTGLDSAHRDTLERIFLHPTSANIEWRQVRSLLAALGAATEERNGKVEVELGGETAVLQRPHDKDVDVDTIVALRRLLTKAGMAP